MLRTAVCGLLVALLCFASCKKELFNGDCTDGEGAEITREITLPDIKKIHLEFQYELELVETGTQMIEIKAAPNIIDLIEKNIVIEDETWHLNDMQGSFCDLPIKIKASIPGLKEIIGEGIFTLKSDEQLDDIDEDFSIVNLGVGNLDLDFGKVQNMEVTTGGHGRVELSGECDNLTVNIASFGGVQAHNLKSKNVEVNLTSMGSADVYASDSLRINLTSGSGRVCYKGMPDYLNVQTIAGTGEVTDCN